MEFIKGISLAPSIFNRFEHMYKEAIDLMDKINGEENGISLAKNADEMKGSSSLKTTIFCTNELQDRQTQVGAQSLDVSGTDIKTTDAYVDRDEDSQAKLQDTLIPGEVEYQMNSSFEHPSLEANGFFKDSNTQYDDDAAIDVSERNIADQVPVFTDLHQINVVFLKASTEYHDNSNNLITYIASVEEDEAASLVDNELPVLEHPIFDEDVSFSSSQDPQLLSTQSDVTDETFITSSESSAACSFQINETEDIECDDHIPDPKSLHSASNIESSGGRRHEHHQMNELITSMFPPHTNSTEVLNSWMNDSKMETLDLSQTIKPEAEATTLHGFVHSASHSRNFVSHYTNLIKQRFASKNRSTKEYKLLHIFHTDIDEESKRNFEPSSVISAPSLDAMRTLASLDLPANEWEVL